MHLPVVCVLSLGTWSRQDKSGGCPSQGLGIQFWHAPSSCELALALATHPEVSECLAGFRTCVALLTRVTLGTLESSSARPEILCMEARRLVKGTLEYETNNFVQNMPFQPATSWANVHGPMLINAILWVRRAQNNFFLHQSVKLI